MALPKRSLLFRLGKSWRKRIDAVIARSSQVPNTPVLDATLFPWLAELRAAMPAIRAEALEVVTGQRIPALHAISPDHRRIAPPDQWRAFFLHG